MSLLFAEAPEVSENAGTEDLSMSTEEPTSLNQSYDMTRAAGRRTRFAAAAARASARKARLRPSSSTSSVPTSTNTATDQTLAARHQPDDVIGNTPPGLSLYHSTHMNYAI